MSLVNKVKGLIESEDATHEYTCERCGTDFESAYADMSSVSCPDCSSTRIRSRVD